MDPDEVGERVAHAIADRDLAGLGVDHVADRIAPGSAIERDHRDAAFDWLLS